MKMTNGVHIIECTEFVKNIWEREGFEVVSDDYELEREEESGELTYQELKSLAKENGINTHGMKKEEILKALNM